MRSITKDPLLAAAKIGTVIVRVLLVIGMIGLGIVGALIAIGPGTLPDTVTMSPAGPEVRGGAVIVILLVLASMGLIYDFVSKLAAVIDTVGEGDPFTLANAARLTRMGWQAIAVQVLAIPVALISAWLETRVDEGHFSVESDLSLTGFALAIVLFILARVFRKGAEMREELEGTV